MGFIAEPFGVIMEFLFNRLAFGNYGVAIILFTIFTRIILFPLTLKQQKSMIQTQKLQPKIDELKANYGDDKNKFAEEQQKLYTKYGVNPMAGCLPTLLQFPLIIAIYEIVRKPLTYIVGLGSDAIAKLGEIATPGAKALDELVVNNFFIKEGAAHAAELSELGVKASSFINMKFLIFDLGVKPWDCISNKDWSLWPLLLIPFLATGITYVSQWLNDPNHGKKKKNDDPAQKSTSLLLKIMPLMTLWFAFILPAALGFYWFVSNVLSMLQTLIMNKFLIKKEE